jgi:2,3,4,5-tetrahydropyridine-2-carboxylate N-succinyltransferase
MSEASERPHPPATPDEDFDLAAPPVRTADGGPAWGFGLATLDARGNVLDVWFPEPSLGHPSHDYHSPSALSALEGPDDVRQVTRRVQHVVVEDLKSPPADAADVWLRLHLLSHRLVRPHAASLDGVFSLLSNVVWTTLGPCAVEGFEHTRLRARELGREIQVYGVDKFPRMLDYVVPTGVRVADADRVRLGAHLAPGTTVMHEGFVNYNAGTLGASMVEGRISAADVGPVPDDHAGVGISLGDDCVVAAGCYVTAGTKLSLPDGSVVKARELSGQSGWLYWRNSVTGAVEAVRRSGTAVELNAALHTND